MLTVPDPQTSKYRLFEAALNVLAAGVVLTAHDAQVIYMNAAARHLVRMRRALCLVNNRLLPIDRTAARVLTSVLSGMHNKSEVAQTLAFPDRYGAGVLATIFPLDTESGEELPLMAAAIFIQDPARTPAFPGEAFAKLYGLTRGELRVIQAMGPGVTLHQVANVLGVGDATVKTHLRRVFEKTNTTRQADVVGLMSRATVPTKTSKLLVRCVD